MFPLNPTAYLVAVPLLLPTRLGKGVIGEEARQSFTLVIIIYLFIYAEPRAMITIVSTRISYSTAYRSLFDYSFTSYRRSPIAVPARPCTGQDPGQL